jgi:hypothetical protein
VLRALLRCRIRRSTVPLSWQRAFPLVIAAVVVVIGSVAAAASDFEWREFALLVLDRRNTLAMAYAHLAPPPSYASVAAADVS